MSYHEGSNWQAKKEDEKKPLYETTTDTELISIDHSEGELIADKLLDEQTSTVNEDDLWNEVDLFVRENTLHGYLPKITLDRLKQKYSITRKIKQQL